ncbi:hypothetical protein [Coleofasciculus chthonoplastes]
MHCIAKRTLPDWIRVRTENLHRARRRIRRLQTDYNQGKTGQAVDQSLQS